MSRAEERAAAEKLWREQVERKTGRPYPESYRPSGDVRQVLAEIEASLSNRVPDLPARPAGAEEAVAVGGEHVAAGQVGTLSFPAGGDPAAVEHEAKRRAWLARWQRCDGR